LKPGFAANDLIGALNSSIINFATGKSDVPPTAAALLRNAGGLFKELPPGTLIEIAGYTDNTGDAAANVVLSQQRADAIRNALIQSGVDPVLLVAKGYGSADPTANNDNEDGRFHNRRIEYHVIK
jgi:OOP family OmpA-OmpF porin